MLSEKKLCFVQRGVGAVRLRQMTVCVCLRIETGVLLMCDVNTTVHTLNLAEMKWCNM